MKIKILLQYGTVGALLIAALAVGLTQLHLTSELTSRLIEIGGFIVFLTLGYLLKRQDTNKN
jgi:threonine/homoserine/homoserine lactone efflux protein